MATSIFFNGQLISVPGSYSEVDASGLEQVGLGASGIVALLGTAEGGPPTTASTEPKDLVRIRRPQQVRDTYRSGNLREAGGMLFDPSRDADIQAGAQEIVFLKTNQSTPSSATFANGYGDAAVVTSEDYGAFTEQISVENQDGSSQGKLITVAFEDVVEVLDNATGDEMFTLQYTEPTGTQARGWDTMVASIQNGGMRAYGTRTEAFRSGDLTVGTTAGGSVVSSDVGDTTQEVTVYGLVGGTPTREVVQLTGTTPKALINNFDINGIFACEMDSVAVGTVTVRDGTPTTRLTMAPGTLESGGVRASAMFVGNDRVNWAMDAGVATDNIWLVGRNASGARTILRQPVDGTRSVQSTVTDWSEIEFIVLSELTANNIIFNAAAVRTSNTVQSTIQKVADHFNARQVTNVGDPDNPFGFDFTIVTGLSTLEMSNMDLSVGVTDCDNPVTANFYADLFFWINFFTVNSSLADASRVAFVPKIDTITITPAVATYTWTINGTTMTFVATAGTAAEIQAGIVAVTNATFGVSPNNLVNTRVVAATSGTNDVTITGLTPDGFTLVESDANLATAATQAQVGSGNVPDNTTQPVFLSGGTEGTAAYADYINALNLLKRVRVNTIVPLTHDPAVHAAVAAHCQYMGGIGRSERDAIVGLQNASFTGVATKDEVKQQIVDLNTRHLRACAQTIDRFNETGERTTFDPMFEAVVAAGMQAGSPVGTSLTYKIGNVLDFAQHSTWNPVDDSEEMVQAGLLFLENVEGIGNRWVRNVTTHLSSNNIAFVEASVNEAVNFAVFNFRTNMEVSVGKKGFSGTINAAKAIAINTLGLLVDAEVLVAYQALSIELIVDVLEVSCQIAPVIPINFVKNTIHLVTVRQTA